MRWTFTKCLLPSWTGLWLAISLCLGAVAARAQNQVPDSTELRVLHQFYEATGGAQWTNQANWPNTPAAWATATLSDAATWFGVGVQNGDVTGLFLQSNNLHGSLPAAFGKLQLLQGLYLAYNQLSGPLPPSFAQLTLMNQCSLDYNQFSGELTGLLDQWTNLQSIGLTHNQFTGPVPGALGALPRLYSFWASDNQLTGPLPAALGRSATLWGLNLSHNRLQGSIPGSWGQMGSLRQLFLGNNQLRGPLSDSLAQLTYLDYFCAENNQLTGPIPAGFRRFNGLSQLNLAANQLTGTVPENLRAFMLLLQNNHLSGELPASYGTTHNWQILLDNNDITRIPYFAQPLGYPNLQLGLTGNYLAFDSYEPNQVTPGQYQFWDYGQRTPPGDTLQVAAGQAAQLDGRIGGAHNHYQWLRLVGGQWVAMPGQTQPGLQWAQVSTADAGTYCTRVTNDWVPGMTLYSRPHYLDVTPYQALARNLPDDHNQGPGAKLAALTPAPDASASPPADVNYVRTWVPRVPLTSEPTKAVSCAATGLILREQWDNVAGGAVSDIPVSSPPASRSYLAALEGPSNLGDNYGDRIRGYLCPPQSGVYTFWIAGDDNCELWLSSDEDPAHKQRLAYVPGWTYPRAWFSAFAEQKSAPVTLVAGRRYYVEVLHKQGPGGDNVSVAWQRPDGTFEGPVPGSYLFPVSLPTGTPVTAAVAPAAAYQFPAPPLVKSVLTPGFLLREQWNNVAGGLVSDIPLTIPPFSWNYVSALEGPSNLGSDYGDRIRGYLSPPQSGVYTFWIAGDDNCELWLSSDEDPTRKQRLAYVPDWTYAREFDKYGEQKSAPITLVAGRRYYVEVLHKQGPGGDNVSVAWQRPDGTFEGPVPGSYLFPALPLTPKVALAPTGADASTWTVDQAQITTQYLDGLGRPIQTVLHQASPQRRDLVQPQAYDGLGREPRQYLPYPADSTRSAANQTLANGFHYQALSEQAQFYYRTTPLGGGSGPLAATDPIRGVARTGVAYAETQFENSPLHRVTAQGAAGETWQLSGGHIQERQERPNTLQDSVLWFTPNYDPRSLDPGYQGYYAAGELWGTDVSDTHGPNEVGVRGYRTIEWKDKLGQVVGKQVEVGRTGSGSASHSRWLRTAYVYDDFGHLRFVLQPEATRRVLPLGTKPASLPAGAAPFLFHYRYDGRGRQVAKQVPGQDGETLVVYDQLDRPVLSQDAQQRTRKEWNWVKYDALGRIIMSGLTTRQDTMGQVRLQALATADTLTSHQYEQRTADRATFAQFYTTTQSFPQLGQNGFSAGLVLSATYYDDYNFDNDAQGVADAQYETSQDAQFPAGAAPVADALRTMGMVTRTRTRVLGVAENDPDQAAWLTTTTFYDERARPVQVQTTNARKDPQTHRPFEELVTTQLDFMGKVVQSVAVHQGPSHLPIQVSEFFTYDHAGRLLSTRQQLPGEARAALLDSVQYNELGQLTRKSLATGRLRQEVDYAYNIRGWLTSLNDPYSPNPTQHDLFGLSLHYERGFTPGYEQYNGNLTGQTWRGRDGVQRAYGYVYDPLNRILQGDFVARAGGSAGTLASATAWNQERDNYRLAFVSYDDNGNILTLRRQGLLKNATHATSKQYGAVDNLTYAYQGNRLQAVDDAVTGNQLPRPANYNGAPTSLAGDFQEQGVHQNQEYSYDANGNLTQDKNKGITGILYNHLNLPRQIHFGQVGDSVVFRYTAAGQKVAKLVYQTGKLAPQRTDYLGPYQYERDSLQFFPHAEGRVLRFVQYDAANQPTVRYQREYTIKDHLGNLRLAYRAGQVRTLTAGLELNQSSIHQRETQQFDSLSVSAPIAQNVSSLARSGAYVAKLNAGSSTPQPLGPLTQLGVQQGDTVTVTAYGYYAQPVQHGFLFSLGSFITSLFQPAQSPPSGLEVQRRKGVPLLQVGIAAGLSTIPQLSGGVPKGYLRVLVFNKDSALISQPVQPLSQAANGGYEPLRIQVIVPQDGYVTAYVGNESDVDVLFDDITVEHRQGIQVQENQYDPWGINLSGINYVSGTTENKFQYGDKERQTEFNLGWSDHGARFYDTQLGRWHVGDPSAEGYESYTPYNYVLGNPINISDPFGTDTVSAGSLNKTNWHNFDTNNDVVALGEATVTGTSSEAPSTSEASNEALDNVQLALDVAGFIPGISTATGLANAGIDLYRGNYGSAAFNVLTAIPLAGVGAKIAILGVKFAKSAEAIKAGEAGLTLVSRWTYRSLPGIAGYARHHIIPQALMHAGDVGAELTRLAGSSSGFFPSFSIHMGENIKYLENGFHTSHPAYNRFVTNKLSDIMNASNGRLTIESIRGVIEEMHPLIDAAAQNYSATFQTLNEAAAAW